MSDQVRDPAALLSTADVMIRLGVGRTTLWKIERTTNFPKPITFGHKIKRWRTSDIDAYVEAQSPG